jgi:hypothetical protein
VGEETAPFVCKTAFPDFRVGAVQKLFDGPLFARSGRGGLECCNMAGIGVDGGSLG